MPKFIFKKRYWIPLVVPSLLFVLLLLPYVISGLKTVTTRVFSVPAKFFNGITEGLGRRYSPLNENKILRRKLAERIIEADRYKDLITENRRLRALLRLKDKYKLETVSAEIIARDPNDWLGVFMIDKGSDDGVEKSSAVCSAQGLLGRVFEVKPDTSLVMLLSHPSFKCGGMLRKSRFSGVVVGGGKGVARILYLPIDAEIEAGELVITSNMSRIFPKGIVIGTIVFAEKSKTGLYKQAVINLSANPNEQEEVLCIK